MEQRGLLRRQAARGEAAPREAWRGCPAREWKARAAREAAAARMLRPVPRPEPVLPRVGRLRPRAWRARRLQLLAAVSLRLAWAVQKRVAALAS